ncbi:F-type H+-transporting ATPase subunit g [Apostasia shenzhenica]|uniref:F-type H+-transporting ATPase subunit g n=1 Tax=Apostasia shenzhenica TaxID=1088818 RepID=A0A2I0A677_9ASPA|nr:F-type H+-transporting ATPase subunit g [Apostasia shenzhenica]
MASKLQQLQNMAVQASQFVTKNGTAYYKQLLEQNKQHIVHPPTLVKCQELSKQLLYTRLARNNIFPFPSYVGPSCATVLQKSLHIPGRYESFRKELEGVKHIWKNRNELKVEDVGIAALFGLELYAWFCVGEIAGRGFTFTGYYV